MSSLEKLLRLLSTFDWVVFLVLKFMSCLYILDISSLSVVSFAVIFSHSEEWLFALLIVSFVVQKLLILIRSHWFTFCFYFQYTRRWVIEDSALIYVIVFRLCFLYELYNFQSYI